MQVNEIFVPFAVLVLGIDFNNNSSHATTISDLLIKAITHNEQRFHRDEAELLSRFRAKPDKMKSVRGRAWPQDFSPPTLQPPEVMQAIYSTQFSPHL